MSAKPFFIVSSGRSGTAMLHKALSAQSDVEMHHEYMVHIVQPLGVRRYMNLIDREAAKRTLLETHVAAVRYCARPHWGDSSNKLSWLIPELAELLPAAKFVHLVRDGRKVASSYFHKLAEECYDDRSTQILRAHVRDGAPPPPPEKKYWWPLPADRADFDGFDQFQRIAWHWAEINRVILDSLAALPPERSHFVRLEDLRASPSGVKQLYEFLSLDFHESQFATFARPHNVNRPEDRLLDDKQRDQFDDVAGDMLDLLGYGARAEYVVNY